MTFEEPPETTRPRFASPVCSTVTPFIPFAQPSMVTLEPMVRVPGSVTLFTEKTIVSLAAVSPGWKQESNVPGPEGASEVTVQIGCPIPPVASLPKPSR